MSCRLIPLIQALLARRWIRFGLVGAAATAAYFLLGLFFVSLLRMPVLAGNALAYVLSFAVSYLGQSVWTFQAGHDHRSMLPRFAAAQAMGLGINSCIVEFCVRLGLSYELAMLMAIAVAPVAVYIICKRWVFRKRGQQQG